jgi:hypothetical protein
MKYTTIFALIGTALASPSPPFMTPGDMDPNHEPLPQRIHPLEQPLHLKDPHTRTPAAVPSAVTVARTATAGTSAVVMESGAGWLWREDMEADLRAGRGMMKTVRRILPGMWGVGFAIRMFVGVAAKRARNVWK